MFVEVAEGGAEGPLHWAEQVSVQDKGYSRLTGMFASPLSSCLPTQLTRCCSALTGGRQLLEIPLQCKQSRQQVQKPNLWQFLTMLLLPRTITSKLIYRSPYKVEIQNGWKHPFKAKQTSGITGFIWTFGGGNGGEPMLGHEWYKSHCSLFLHNSPPGLLQLVKCSAGACSTAMPGACSVKHSNWEILMQKLLAIFTQFQGLFFCIYYKGTKTGRKPCCV